GRETEEAGVEMLDIAQDGRGLHVQGVSQRFRADSCLSQLLVREERHGLDAVAQVLPERFDAGGSRKPARHTDDGDFQFARGRARHRLPPIGPAAASQADANCSRVWKISSRGFRLSPMAFSTRASTRIESSEWPPRSKKLSWTETRGTPSASVQIPATRRSIGVRGST